MMHQIVLVPDSNTRPFLHPLPDLLNQVQNDFRFSIGSSIVGQMVSNNGRADLDDSLAVAYQIKRDLGLRDEDLLIRFIGNNLESVPRGLANLFIAGSTLSEQPPRVAVISTSFIYRHILPTDPTYLLQRHAFLHLVVCCISAIFTDLEVHEDRGCLLDFNNYTPNIRRKIASGYTFCPSCASHVEQHVFGKSLFGICTALKLGAATGYQAFPARERDARPKVFLCYAGPDRAVISALYNRLRYDGVEPWMDKKNLVGGQDWQLQIERAIRSADFFVACISSHFANRTYGHREVKLALEVLETTPEGDIYLIPVRLEECTIEDRLSNRQWIDLFDEGGYESLLTALRLNQDSASNPRLKRTDTALSRDPAA